MKQTTMAGMQWTVAEPGHRVLAASLAVNIPQGKLSLSVGAYKLAGSPRFVRLMFSPSPASIAVVPTTDKDELGYAIVSSAGRKRANGKGIGAHHQTLSRHFCRMLQAAGYHGTLIVPLSWHPEGMLWGDLTTATTRERKMGQTKGAKAA